MDWCTKQGATHLATLVDKDKVAELDSEARSRPTAATPVDNPCGKSLLQL